MYVTWSIPTWDMAHWYTWHDSFTYMTWLIDVRDMIHSYIWHGALIYVTWLIHIHDVTHRCIWDDSWIPVTWRTRMYALFFGRFFHWPLFSSWTVNLIIFGLGFLRARLLQLCCTAAFPPIFLQLHKRPLWSCASFERSGVCWGAGEYVTQVSFYTNIHICEHNPCRLCTYVYMYVCVYMHAYACGCVCASMILLDMLRRCC